MLKLKLQYFGHLLRRTDSLEKTLMLGKTKGGRNFSSRPVQFLQQAPGGQSPVPSFHNFQAAAAHQNPPQGFWVDFPPRWSRSQHGMSLGDVWGLSELKCSPPENLICLLESLLKESAIYFADFSFYLIIILFVHSSYFNVYIFYNLHKVLT